MGESCRNKRLRLLRYRDVSIKTEYEDSGAVCPLSEQMGAAIAGSHPRSEVIYHLD